MLNTTDADLTDPAVITKLEQEWSAKLTSMAHDALVMSQKELRTDFFKFAVEFRRYYPNQWKKQEKNWETIYPELDVEVKVEAHVVRTGKSTGPQGIPDEDEN